MTASATKPRPSDEQVATVLSAIEHTNAEAIVAWMDESGDGTMMLNLVEDELSTTGRFGRNGRIIGDWL